MMPRTTNAVSGALRLCDSGFGLLEVMVAVGITGILVFGAGSAIVMASTVNRGIEAKNALIGIVRDTDQALTNKSTCLSLLQGASVPDPESGANVSLFLNDGNDRLDPGTSLGPFNGGAEIEAIRLENFSDTMERRNGNRVMTAEVAIRARIKDYPALQPFKSARAFFALSSDGSIVDCFSKHGSSGFCSTLGGTFDSKNGSCTVTSSTSPAPTPTATPPPPPSGGICKSPCGDVPLESACVIATSRPDGCKNLQVLGCTYGTTIIWTSSCDAKFSGAGMSIMPLRSFRAKTLLPFTAQPPPPGYDPNTMY